MKLPGLFPVAFFAGGILLSVYLKSFALLDPRLLILAALLFLLAGYFARFKNRLWAGLASAAVAWLSLGIAAQNLERLSAPQNLAATQIESGTLDPQVALRWRGRRRGDPLELPWGRRYEISLEEVETLVGAKPVTG